MVARRNEQAGKAMLERALSEDRQAFGSFFLSRLLGFQVTYEGETCIVAFEAIEPMFNPQGTLHGGILATAMDISMGHLLHHVDRAGATLEMKVQYLAAISAGPVRCEATFLRRGRNICFCNRRPTAATASSPRTQPPPGDCCRQAARAKASELRRLSRLLEQLAADQPAADLGCAGADFVELGVAQ
jgi:uncharacterized protein (TIGR00369 family)